MTLPRVLPDPMAKAMSERELESAVLEIAATYGWLRFHAARAFGRDGRMFTAQRGDTGFLDLVLARRGSIVVTELKALQGRLSPPQRDWLGELSGDPIWATGSCEAPVYRALGDGCRLVVAVFTPADLRSGEIERVLR